MKLQDLRMSAVQVLTSLAQDEDSINVLTLGQSLQVVVQHHDREGEETDTEPPSDSPAKELVTAKATRLLTGTMSSSDLHVAVRKDGEYVVTFPKVTEKDDYSLSVFYKEEHVKGSPFFLRYVEPVSLSSIHTEMRRAVTDAGRPINLVLPLEKAGEVSVNIEGPFGKCEAEVSHHSLDQSISVYFMPKGAGAYTMHIKVDQEELENSPLLLLADFSSEEAQECFIFRDDEWVFKKPLQFQPGEVQSFHVSTERVRDQPSDLIVLCSGPAEASVTISRDPDVAGVERCEVLPTAAGDYRLSILWQGQHITGSPCVMRFRKPKSKIGSDLNLHQRVYELGVPCQFELSCDGSPPDITCTPAEACGISVTPVRDGDHTYKCELLPLQAGSHTVSIKYKDDHVEGSPFPVEFKDSSKLCKIIGGSRSYKTGGSLKLKISTKGAGRGTLEATAEDPDTKIAISLATTQIADDLYQVEFGPGENTLCDLSVTFNRQHIPGSPFRLTLSNPEKFKVAGEGLVGGRVGEWNKFILSVKDPPPGALQVNMEYGGGLKAETNVSPSGTPNQFEVQYLPPVSGDYKIRVKWGQIPIPGSPFCVRCSSTTFQVKDVPRRVQAGMPLEFEVQLISSEAPELDGCLEVISRTLKGRNLRGQAVLVDKSNHIYHCTLTPRQPGSYTVGIVWNKLHIKGSPFAVKAVALPKPEMVRVCGVGVEGAGEVGEEAIFTVETEHAGGGMLAIRIRGPSKELKFDTSRDSVNKRTLHAKYCPTVPGEHSIEVEWAGRHVPGSPFKVMVREKRMVVAEVHPEIVAVNMESLEEQVEFETEGVELRAKGVESEAEGEEPRTGQPDSKDESHYKSLDSVNTPERLGPTLPITPTGAGLTPPTTSTGVGLTPPTTPTGTEPVATPPGDSMDRSVSVSVKKQDSGYTSSTHQDYKHRGSVSSMGSSTTSLYKVLQLDTRRCSEDQISIQLEGPTPIRLAHLQY